jgi:hypothetical protein
VDALMAVRADHQGLAPATCHELRPFRLWLPVPGEVGELADLVDFHLPSLLA